MQLLNEPVLIPLLLLTSVCGMSNSPTTYG